MASKNAIATLLVSIGADISGLEGGAARANKSMAGLGSQAAALGKQMAAIGAAAVAAGAAMVAGLVKAGIDSIDTQAKLSRSIGSTIDGLRGLQLAAGEAGVGSEDLSTTMRALNQRLGEAQRGTGDAAKAFKLLGLDAEALSKLDADQRMAAIADRVRELGLSSAQTADFLRRLGVRSLEMTDFIRSGGDAIRAAREDIDELGLSVSAVDAAKIELANDAMERIGLTFESVRNQIAIAFAPILGELANRFNELSKANGGFGEIAKQVAESVIMSFAKVADVIQGLRVVFKGVELIAVGFKAAMVSLGQVVAEIFAGIYDNNARVVNLIIRGLNLLGASIDELPLATDSQFMASLRKFGDEARDDVGRVRSELHELAMQELPSDKVEKFLQDVKARAQEAAEAVVAAQSGMGGTFESTDEEAEKEREKREKELERQREALQAKIDQIREFALTEADLEIVQHEERLARLREALEAELITKQDYHSLEERLTEDHAKRLEEIRKKNMTDLEKFTNASMFKQVGIVSGHLADMTASVAHHSKAMFEINKIAGIANAIVSAYEGISLTMSKYPYPLNIGMAALHAAAAFAQVNAIRSQSFGGGGGAAPSLAGGTPATPVTPVTGGTPQAAAGGASSLLTVEGVDPDSLFSGRTVRALAERLQEHLRDGGKVSFA